MLNANVIEIMRKKPIFTNKALFDKPRDVFRGDNFNIVSHAIRCRNGVSRADLIEESGLSKSVVDCVVRVLAKNGDVRKVLQQKGRTRISIYHWNK